MEYVLDRRARRFDGGRLVLGGEPVRLVKLSETGARILDELVERRPTDSSGAPAAAPVSASRDELAARLVSAGILHPLPDEVAGLGDVTAVIPVHGAPSSLGRLVASLVRAGVGAVVVVDDGSPDGGEVAARAAEAPRATVLRRRWRGGPSAARNTAVVTTPFVAYLDADVELEVDDPGRWLRRCVAHLADEKVALVAPRVATKPPSSSPSPSHSSTAIGSHLWAYEERQSPLDLGEAPGLVGVGRRLSYVPAAALVARRSVIEAAGGFDETLRYGEDVDLVRRLGATGALVRYEPSAVVFHQPRSDLAGFVRQRMGYGSAAAAIDARHPGSVPPFVASPAGAVGAAGALLSLAAGGPRSWRGLLVASAALGAGLQPFGRLQHRLGESGCPRPLARAASISLRAQLATTAGLLAALRRAYWPALLPALALRPSRRAAAMLLLGANLAGHGRHALAAATAPRLRAAPVAERLAAGASQLGLGLLDDTAYGLGVLAGCVREGSAGALRPRIRATPTGPPSPPAAPGGPSRSPSAAAR